MTTDRTRRPLMGLLLAAALAFSACLGGEGFGKRGGLSEKQVAELPMDVQASYGLFAQKCSRCHTLARPLSAQITDFEHWRAYVARMRRQSGSGISPSDAETILVFLKYRAAQKAKEAKETKEAGGPGTSTSTGAAPREGGKP